MDENLAIVFIIAFTVLVNTCWRSCCFLEFIFTQLERNTALDLLLAFGIKPVRLKSYSSAEKVPGSLLILFLQASVGGVHLQI